MLTKDFREFIGLLNEKKVEYLLVGGYAVILHGYPRYTGDIDFWINPTHENGEKVLSVLDAFGFGSLKLVASDFRKEDQIIQLGYPPLRIDLMTSIAGLSFQKSYPSSVIFEIDGLPIRTISKNHLKENKRASGRHKDLDDLEHLP